LFSTGNYERKLLKCSLLTSVVVFVGEKRISTFAPGQLRHSLEWVDGKWSPVEERKDLVAVIIATTDSRQNRASSPEEMKSETLRETFSPTDDAAQEGCTTSSEPDLRKDLMLDGLKWSSRKRRRFSPNRVKRSPGSSSGCSQEETEPSACGSFVLLDSSDRENCKIGRDSLFSVPPVAISNLVMSQ
jgi:hypothetical protein